MEERSREALGRLCTLSPRPGQSPGGPGPFSVPLVGAWGLDWCFQAGNSRALLLDLAHALPSWLLLAHCIAAESLGTLVLCALSVFPLHSTLGCAYGLGARGNPKRSPDCET